MKARTKTRIIPRGASLAVTLFMIGCSPVLPRLAEERSGKFSFGPEEMCEPSGVVFDGTHCFFVNDKPIPGRSPIFRFPFRNGNIVVDAREDLNSPLFFQARKWEDIARTPDGKYFLAVTAFDRSDDAYRHLVGWPSGRPGEAHRVSGPVREGIASALGGVKYFKVEGLSFFPGNRILFGIRALGKSWKESAYVCRIVSVSYRSVDGNIRLGDDYLLWYVESPGMIPEGAGISGLEYDFERGQLYVLLSVEKKNGLGGYLGILSGGCSVLEFVRDQEGKPLRFPRKPEGITVLDGDHILLVYDDDRVESEGRKKHEAVYTIFIRN